jgi:hypothetical protein
MKEDGSNAPLSRRVPGSIRSGPSQPARPVFSDTDVYRIQAAIDAEHANTEMPTQREPNTEPLSRVTDSGPGTKHAGHPPAARERAAKAPGAEESLRAAKALRAAEELRAAEKPRAVSPRRAEKPASATGRLRPEKPVVALEPVRAEEPVHAPELVLVPEPVATEEPAFAAQPVITAEFPRRTEMPKTTWSPASAEPAPGTIGWLWPEGTATQGASRRWQQPGWWSASGRWRYRTATLVAVGAVVLAAGGVAVGMSLQEPLAGTGVQATSGPKAGTHATAKRPKRHVVSPAAGAGSATGGGSPAPTAPSQDVQARMKLGKQLLNSGKVSGSAAAEGDLEAGAVDARLLLVIKAIADLEPVYVVGFADAGPGASAGVPFRLMTLGETDPAASVSAPVYLHQLIALLLAHATFPAFDHVGQVALADGQKAVQVEYAAPSALGG